MNRLQRTVLMLAPVVGLMWLLQWFAVNRPIVALVLIFIFTCIGIVNMGMLLGHRVILFAAKRMPSKDK